MGKRKSCLWLVMICSLMLLFSSAAEAVLTVNFPEDVDKDRLQYYWIDDTQTPDSDVRTINSTPGVVLDLADLSKQAKVDPTPRAFHFGCDEAHLKSNTIYIRLWNSAARNNTYTDKLNFSNTALGTVVSDFGAITYRYIKAAPAIAVINQYDDTGTTVLYPAPASSRRVTFSSVQPPRADGMEVEIPESKWNIIYNGTFLRDQTASGKSLTLSTPADALNPGDSYTVKVKHKNYWGEWSSDWSSPVTYIIGAGGGGALTVTCDFKAPSALGVNQFSVPFSGAISFIGPSLTARSVSTIQDLINAVVAEGVIVNTFGWWDPARQVMVGWSDLGGIPRAQNSPGNLTDPLVKDRAYQMSVSAPISFTLSGTR